MPEAEEVEVEIRPRTSRSTSTDRAARAGNREHDRLGRADRAQADRDPRRGPGGALAAAEPREGDAVPARPPVPWRSTRRRRRRRRGAPGAARHRRALREDPDLQLPGGPGDGSPEQPTSHQLADVLGGGRLDRFIDALLAAERAEQLARGETRRGPLMRPAEVIRRADYLERHGVESPDANAEPDDARAGRRPRGALRAPGLFRGGARVRPGPVSAVHRDAAAAPDRRAGVPPGRWRCGPACSCRARRRRSWSTSPWRRSPTEPRDRRRGHRHRGDRAGREGRAPRRPGVGDRSVAPRPWRWRGRTRRVSGSTWTSARATCSTRSRELRGGVDLVVANPPYVPLSRADLPRDVPAEPALALFGGIDVYERLLAHAFVVAPRRRPGGGDRREAGTTPWCARHRVRAGRRPARSHRAGPCPRLGGGISPSWARRGGARAALAASSSSCRPTRSTGSARDPTIPAATARLFDAKRPPARSDAAGPRALARGRAAVRVRRAGRAVALGAGRGRSRSCCLGTAVRQLVAGRRPDHDRRADPVASARARGPGGERGARRDQCEPFGRSAGDDVRRARGCVRRSGTRVPMHRRAAGRGRVHGRRPDPERTRSSCAPGRCRRSTRSPGLRPRTGPLLDSGPS